VLTTDLPDKGNTVTDFEPVTPMVLKTPLVPLDEATERKLERDNKLARSYLLNNMSNPLFDLFVSFKSAKVIWTKLETKYGSDDAGKRKYVVGKWLQFQIMDDKPIMEQVHVYENLCVEVLAEGMKMCEILQANVLIENFPPSWSDYRNNLKHKKKDLTLQELISHLRTKEANRLKDKMSSLSLNSVSSKLVEFAVQTNKDRFKGKGKKFQKPTQNLRNQNSANKRI